MSRRTWDIVCRVVDNYGDLGVSWRLARQLHQRGEVVRLWVDDMALAARMTTPGPALEIMRWPASIQAFRELTGLRQPPTILIEMFGGDVPEPLVQALAPGGVWINLEYLSAEGYVDRSHRLPSPLGSGPGAGRTRWFFYPGFTDATGGLLREPDLRERQVRFNPPAWRAAWGVAEDRANGRPQHHISVFAYPQAPLEGWLDAWVSAQQAAGRDTVLWMCDGPLQERARAWIAQRPALKPQVQVVCLPWLSHDEFDHLLWACDLNAVRGEDSLVRSLWAGKPQLWQLYAQDDGAHHAKLDAFLQRQGTNAVPWADLARWWNGRTQELDPQALQRLAHHYAQPQAWAELTSAAQAWAAALAEQASLVDALVEFVELRMKG